MSPKCRCAYVHCLSNIPSQAKEPQCIQWSWEGLIDELEGDSEEIWYNTGIWCSFKCSSISPTTHVPTTSVLSFPPWADFQVWTSQIPDAWAAELKPMWTVSCLRCQWPPCPRGSLRHPADTQTCKCSRCVSIVPRPTPTSAVCAAWHTPQMPSISSVLQVAKALRSSPNSSLACGLCTV